MFLVKDLLVSVLRPDRKGADAAEYEPIAAGTTVCWVPSVEASANEMLRALKSYLKKALDDIDREGEAFCERLRPDTLREVEVLQAQFDKAQAELKKLRKELG